MPSFWIVATEKVGYSWIWQRKRVRRFGKIEGHVLGLVQMYSTYWRWSVTLRYSPMRTELGKIWYHLTGVALSSSSWNFQKNLCYPPFWCLNLRRGLQVSQIFSSSSDAIPLLGNNSWFQMIETGFRWEVLGLSQDGAFILFENLSVNSLKGDLSNATTFNPPLFSLVNTFKSFFEICLKTCLFFWISKGLAGSLLF